jgi:exopolysaccharide biosynthesis protein
MTQINLRKRYPSIIALLYVLCAFVVASRAQEFRTVAPGVEHARVTRQFSGEPVIMNLLRLDLTKVRLDVVHANDKDIGTQTVSSMARRHKAFAAINGGFFKEGSDLAGKPAGLLKIDGVVISEPSKDRVSIAIKNERRRTYVSFAHGSNNDPAAKRFISAAEDITNGVPQLIKNGKVDLTWEQEKTNLRFVETRHPRTAVAKLKSGKFLMVTVDGRSESSGGISLFDLADYLLSLAATDAMNLDGGGSSTMYLDGRVVNHPSDPTGERKVGDAILVTLRPNAKRRPHRGHR